MRERERAFSMECLKGVEYETFSSVPNIKHLIKPSYIVLDLIQARIISAELKSSFVPDRDCPF